MGKFYQNLSKSETPEKSWKGEFQTNVQIKKLHKPFYFKKTKWLVLSKKGNIYLFNKPDSTEINSIFSMKDFSMQFNLDKILLFNDKHKLKLYFKNNELDLFLKSYHNTLDFQNNIV